MFPFVLAHSLLGFAGSPKPEEPAPAVVEAARDSRLIAGHTRDGITPHDAIEVRLTTTVAEPDLYGYRLEPSPIRLVPEVRGQAHLERGVGLVFTPAAPLEIGQTYQVLVDLGKLEVAAAEDGYRVSPGLAEHRFGFEVSVLPQSYRVVNGSLVAGEGNTSQYSGSIETEGRAIADQVEEVLAVDGMVRWRHSEDGRSHRFTISGIEHEERGRELLLRFDGGPIGVPQTSVHDVEIPSLSSLTAGTAWVGVPTDHPVFGRPWKSLQEGRLGGDLGWSTDGLVLLRLDEDAACEASVPPVVLFDAAVGRVVAMEQPGGSLDDLDWGERALAAYAPVLAAARQRGVRSDEHGNARTVEVRVVSDCEQNGRYHLWMFDGVAPTYWTAVDDPTGTCGFGSYALEAPLIVGPSGHRVLLLADEDGLGTHPVAVPAVPEQPTCPALWEAGTELHVAFPHGQVPLRTSPRGTVVGSLAAGTPAKAVGVGVCSDPERVAAQSILVVAPGRRFGWVDGARVQPLERSAPELGQRKGGVRVGARVLDPSTGEDTVSPTDVQPNSIRARREGDTIVIRDGARQVLGVVEAADGPWQRLVVLGDLVVTAAPEVPWGYRMAGFDAQGVRLWDREVQLCRWIHTAVGTPLRVADPDGAELVTEGGTVQVPFGAVARFVSACEVERVRVLLDDGVAGWVPEDALLLPPRGGYTKPQVSRKGGAVRVGNNLLDPLDGSLLTQAPPDRLYLNQELQDIVRERVGHGGYGVDFVFIGDILVVGSDPDHTSLRLQAYDRDGTPLWSQRVDRR